MAGQGVRGHELIARGNTSDIYAWTPRTVVKVLRPHIPRQWASIEADITGRVHAAGLPVPATEGVMEVATSPATTSSSAAASEAAGTPSTTVAASTAASARAMVGRPPGDPTGRDGRA